MGRLVYRSRVSVLPVKRGVKHAIVEPFPEVILTGQHGAIKEWYRTPVDEELPTTPDHVVAAVAS